MEERRSCAADGDSSATAVALRTQGRPVGAVVKIRWGVVFGGNFGSGADIILRLVLVWLIRHSAGRGAEECA